MFTRSKQTKDREEGQSKDAGLFQQIGRLQMELEWLKKSLSCSDAMYSASWSITTTQISASVGNMRCLACLARRSTTS
jgi:hypothetical protein